MLAYLPDGTASRTPSTALPWPLLPPGFVITGAMRLGGVVRIEAQPEEAI
jgi:hypothetical protein